MPNTTSSEHTQPARSAVDEAIVDLFAPHAAYVHGDLDAYSTDHQARDRWRAIVRHQLFEDPPFPLAS